MKLLSNLEVKLIHTLGTMHQAEMSLSAELKPYQTYLYVYTTTKLLCILLDIQAIDNISPINFIHISSEKILDTNLSTK